MTDELAAARLLPTAECVARTRELLTRVEIAASPEAWAQLASAALRAGLREDAADAAAEGLARDGDHEVLLELLLRARGELETPTIARTWQMGAGELLAVVREHVVVADGGRVELWTTAGVRTRMIDVGATVTCLAARDEQVVVGTAAGDLHVWDVDSGEVTVLETPLAQTDDQRLRGFDAGFGFALGGGDPLQYPELMAELAPRKLALTHVSLSSRLVAGNARHVMWWEQDRFLGEIEDSPRLLGGAGHEAIVARAHDLVALEYDRSDPTHVFVQGSIRTLHVRDGLVLAGCEDGRILRFAGRTELDPLVGHEAPVTAIACGGDLIVSASEDGSLRWWLDGHAIARAHAEVCAVAVTEAGAVVTAPGDGTLVVWTSERVHARRLSPQLEVMPEAGTPFVVELAAPRTMVGRLFDCDVRLDDPRVASEHFEIVRERDRYRLHDRGTLVGTWLDRVRVMEDRWLLDGDEIEIVNFRFVFRR